MPNTRNSPSPSRNARNQVDLQPSYSTMSFSANSNHTETVDEAKLPFSNPINFCEGISDSTAAGNYTDSNDMLLTNSVSSSGSRDIEVVSVSLTRPLSKSSLVSSIRNCSMEDPISDQNGQSKTEDVVVPTDDPDAGSSSKNYDSNDTNQAQQTDSALNPSNKMASFGEHSLNANVENFPNQDLKPCQTTKLKLSATASPLDTLLQTSTNIQTHPVRQYEKNDDTSAENSSRENLLRDTEQEKSKNKLGNDPHDNSSNKDNDSNDDELDPNNDKESEQDNKFVSLLETKYNDPWLRRDIPVQISSYLRPGSLFIGTQHSEAHSYEVKVTIKAVDMSRRFLSGYLSIWGLTREHELMKTYFEGEMISDSCSFFTRRDEWNASDQVDRNHWGRFSSWRELAAQKHIDPDYIHKDFEKNPHIYMRWKERFLVPDYRVTKVNGVAYNGFYYICFNQLNGSIAGVYYHSSSPSYQQLDLSHCPDRGTWPSYEFR